MPTGTTLVTHGFVIPSPNDVLLKGTIELEKGWQLCAIPIKFGRWSINQHKHIHDNTIAKFKNYVMDQIDDLYGTGKILVANTFTGDNQYFYNFVPNLTSENSVNNFNLVYNDNSSYEVMGFWIKSLSPTPLIISWG